MDLESIHCLTDKKYDFHNDTIIIAYHWLHSLYYFGLPRTFNHMIANRVSFFTLKQMAYAALFNKNHYLNPFCKMF